MQSFPLFSEAVGPMLAEVGWGKRGIPRRKELPLSPGWVWEPGKSS